jgi:hypothetical protein
MPMDPLALLPEKTENRWVLLILLLMGAGIWWALATDEPTCQEDVALLTSLPIEGRVIGTAHKGNTSTLSLNGTPPSVVLHSAELGAWSRTLRAGDSLWKQAGERTLHRLRAPDTLHTPLSCHMLELRKK